MKNENESQSLRKELMQKYIDYGLESLSELETLKLILSFSGNKNISDLAVRLLNHYGSIGNIFKTDVKIILKDNDINRQSAVLLRLITVISRLYHMDRENIHNIGSTESASYFLKNYYIGVSEEKIAVIAMNDDFSIKAYNFLSSGTNMSVSLSCHDISKFALSHDANIIIISHNHPFGSSEPSENDISITRQIIHALKNINITLIDHIIVGQHECFSMREHFSDTLFVRIADYGYKYNIHK
ncbi:MAG: hypothetical protein K2G14_03735 [Ruminococcus sp.]|nr:hypothetical protein [Ruminococcus sp.]